MRFPTSRMGLLKEMTIIPLVLSEATLGTRSVVMFFKLETGALSSSEPKADARSTGGFTLNTILNSA